MKYLPLALALPFALLLAAAAPAAAQTARIVHASHGGSLETLDAAADNFGEVAPYFLVDSIRLLTDTTALEYGKWAGKEAADISRVYQFSRLLEEGNSDSARVRYFQYYRRNSSRPVRFVGDTVLAAGKATRFQPTKSKAKRPRKRAALTLPPAVPGGPTPSGGLLAVAGALVLAGAGWLLAGPDTRPLAPA